MNRYLIFGRVGDISIFSFASSAPLVISDPAVHKLQSLNENGPNEGEAKAEKVSLLLIERRLLCYC